MRVGLHLCLFTAQPSAAHVPLLKQIKTWGFDGVELHIRATPIDDLRQLGRAAADLGLGTVANLVMPADVADPASTEAPLRRAAVDMMKQAVDKAVALGSDLVVGPMFQGLGRFTGKPPLRREWQWAADCIEEAAHYASSGGVRFALEPLARFEMYMANTISQALDFTDMIGRDNVGILADTYHGNIEENDVASAWLHAARRIFHVHISENHRGTPGTGHACGIEIFRALRAMNYDGWLNIEAPSPRVEDIATRHKLWRPLWTSEESLATQGLAHIRTMWQSVY
jgi:D-psicose/D-tagatose/L-ribulose 3-epimerase